MKRNRTTLGLIVASTLLLGLGPVAPLHAEGFSEWSAPVNLGPTVNSPFTDFGLAISWDGLSLYISSDRPGGFGGEDIWVSRRASRGAPWGPPVNLGPQINTSSRDIVPNFSRDGHWMFFSSNRPGGRGRFDIWVSWRANPLDDFGWQPPVNLGPGVNSDGNELAPHYFENEDGGIPLLFFSAGGPGGPTDFDTYVSALASDGSFGPAVLVPELNSPQNDTRPYLAHDGREIFFYSSRPGSIGGIDLWVATRETTRDEWSTPVNLGATINSAFDDQHPTLSADGETFIFSSNRPGGLGGYDLYMSRRTDTKPPATAASLSPSPRASGWSNGDVTVTLAAIDNPGGVGVREITYWSEGARTIASTTIPGALAAISFSAEGRTTLTSAALDVAGNTEVPRSITVQIDKTPPTVTYAGRDDYLVDETVRITCSASDDLSGIGARTCAEAVGLAYTFGVGEHLLTAVAFDRAGNSATAATRFTVRVTYESLSHLTRQFISAASVAEALSGRLDAAAEAAARGDSRAKNNALAAYTAGVTVQSGAALTAERAQILVRLAEAL